LAKPTYGAMTISRNRCKASHRSHPCPFEPRLEAAREPY
jgi:hypothetical protein